LARRPRSLDLADDRSPMNVSILVPAHNEARNIQSLLESLLAQETRRARIIEIVVVASGCTDDTAPLARQVSRGKPGMHVVVQEQRGGKVAAINEYLNVRDKRAEIVVISGADLHVSPPVIEKIVECFTENPKVGMVGVRPVPDNDRPDVVSGMVRVLWELHHRIALETPKMGELVAFRAALVDRVSELSVVDEASVEDIVRSKGFELAYVPDAIVTNHGPEELDEYFEQRRRIARGHYWLDFAFGYKVSTMVAGPLLRTTLDVLKDQNKEGRKALAAAVAVELAARAAGFIDARIIGGRHRTWRPLRSTKQLKLKKQEGR
jgi:cellulose synthase/poly-beta-1,6-N-acetylglucosamine synthase-like glycosyltransferase